MKIITISGLDGSGKSTQVEMLKNYLESQNKRVFYFHAIEQSIAKKTINFRNKYCLVCKLSKKCETSPSVTRANVFQIFLRKIFLRIDAWRFNRLRNKLRNLGYDYILSDRYFYDSAINIEYLSESQYEVPFLVSPDMRIYLQASPEFIMHRERVPDQGIDYLKKKNELYDNKINVWNMKVVNGNRDKNVIFEEIQGLVPSS